MSLVEVIEAFIISLSTPTFSIDDFCEYLVENIDFEWFLRANFNIDPPSKGAKVLVQVLKEVQELCLATENLVQEKLVKFMTDTLVNISSSSQTSYPKFSLDVLKKSLIDSKDFPIASTSSSSTKKRKIEDISTSTTLAPIQEVTVDAVELEDSLSEEEIDPKFLTAVPLEKKDGITGCTTSVLARGKCYTWRSEKKISPASYIDIKYWDDLRDIRKLTAQEAWKFASFRSKQCLRKTPKMMKIMKELKEALLEEAEKYPGVVKDVSLDSKKK